MCCIGALVEIVLLIWLALWPIAEFVLPAIFIVLLFFVHVVCKEIKIQSEYLIERVCMIRRNDDGLDCLLGFLGVFYLFKNISEV